VVGMSDTLNCSSIHLQTDCGQRIVQNIFYHFEASYEVAEPTSQLKLISVHCNDELRPKFKEVGLSSQRQNIQICSRRHVFVQVCLGTHLWTNFLIDKAK
jgi:hypothetical protein